MFIVRWKNYTWIFKDYAIFIFSFIITFMIGLAIKCILEIYKSIRNFIKKREIDKKNNIKIRGGAEIIECINNSEGVYGIVNSDLKFLIKEALGEKFSNSVIFISDKVFLLGVILLEKGVRPKLFKRITNTYRFGLKNAIMQFILGNALEISTNIGGSLAALSGLSVGLILVLRLIFGFNIYGSLTYGGLTTFAGWAILISTYYNCEDVVKYIKPTEIQQLLTNQLANNYVFLPPAKEDRMYIKINEDLPIFQMLEIKNQVCEEVFDDSKKISAKVKCKEEKDFIPLKQRTKTLKDIRKYDDSETLELLDQNYKQLEKKRMAAERIKDLDDYL